MAKGPLTKTFFFLKYSQLKVLLLVLRVKTNCLVKHMTFTLFVCTFKDPKRVVF